MVSPWGSLIQEVPWLKTYSDRLYAVSGKVVCWLHFPLRYPIVYIESSQSGKMREVAKDGSYWVGKEQQEELWNIPNSSAEKALCAWLLDRTFIMWFADERYQTNEKPFFQCTQKPRPAVSVSTKVGLRRDFFRLEIMSFCWAKVGAISDKISFMSNAPVGCPWFPNDDQRTMRIAPCVCDAIVSF